MLGQPDASSVSENRGGECSASTLYWPFGIAVVGSTFWVADTGNRRVLGWRNGIPEPDQPADIVLGQPDAASREENRGAPAGPESFRWPHDITGHDDLLLVADAGDHRVLGWSPQPQADRGADIVLGQPDFASADEWPYGPHTNDRFRFPYAACLDTGGRTSDRGCAARGGRRHRQQPHPAVGRRAVDGRGADHVLAQHDFGSNGENRWTSVQRDTLCWPYGLSLRGDTLAVADSGNNRVMRVAAASVMRPRIVQTDDQIGFYWATPRAPRRRCRHWSSTTTSRTGWWPPTSRPSTTH